MPVTPELGIVEGYFGPPWSWAERRATMECLSEHGYRFFIYAPKADAFLRRCWREPYPNDTLSQLAAFAAACRAVKVRFGIGLSPYETYLNFDAQTRDMLAAKLAQLDSIGVDDLAILFDDMRGDLPDLAARQLEIVDFAAARTKASRIILCPSYYSDDPVLDRVFGARPPGYLQTLGRSLDASINLFWTGEEVCARAFSVGHLDAVAERLRRKPLLWDNYPVNDGVRMSQHLHLRAFTGRPAAIANRIAAHAINPALQPTLTRIPAITLTRSYAMGDDYRYGEALKSAADLVLGSKLAKMIREDLIELQDTGLDRLGERTQALHQRYSAIDHAGAREVLKWLNGGYQTADEIVRTQ